MSDKRKPMISRSIKFPMGLWEWCERFAKAKGQSAASVVRGAIIEKRERETPPEVKK